MTTKNVDSNKLALEAVNDLNCHKYMFDYKECVIQKKTNYKDCIKIMDAFRYCLLYKD